MCTQWTTDPLSGKDSEPSGVRHSVARPFEKLRAAHSKYTHGPSAPDPRTRSLNKYKYMPGRRTAYVGRLTLRKQEGVV